MAGNPTYKRRIACHPGAPRMRRGVVVSEQFVSQHALEYPGGYTRSVGPVVGAFLTGLRDGRLVGVRTPTGKVVVPPTEYDPQTSESVGGADAEFVEVGPAGTVTTWTWVHKVRPS